MGVLEAQKIVQQLQAHQNMIEQLQDQLAQPLAPPPVPVQAAPAPPALIAFLDPGRYDGKNIWSYPQWRLKVSAKLRADRERLGDLEQQAWYIFLHLASAAADRASPWMQQQQNALTPEVLLSHLDAYYLDPTHQEKACQELFEIKQENQSLSSFLPFFDQLLLEAGGANWPEQAIIALLRRSINRELLVFLISPSPIRAYDELKKALKDIDNNAELLKSAVDNQKRLDRYEQPAKPRLELLNLNNISSSQRAKRIVPVRDSEQEFAEGLKTDWKNFVESNKCQSETFTIHTLLDKVFVAKTLIDTGCAAYGVISSGFACSRNLKRMDIDPRTVKSFNGSHETILKVVCADMDVGGHTRHRAYMYVVSRLRGYDLILGRPWLNDQGAVVDARERNLFFRVTGVIVDENNANVATDIRPINANEYTYWKKNKRRHKGVELFSASLADIEKALKPRTHGDPREKLPPRYHEYLDVFSRRAAETLPPKRGPEIDLRISVEQDPETGREKEIPWGPLYSMSRDELLVLRKTLTELLDKGFIRVSNSPAAAPVLFVKKPGGGLRFCVDYRALNSITRKDRYPLPLLNETLERVGKAKYFTKLDVISAFHQIRVTEEDSWKTAFRTRYGLFEWLVTPFGLANAPSTFQRYVNWVLREYLDIFCSTYVDDILIFSDDIESHRKHTKLVLNRLKESGLRLDIDKCEFESNRTTYLGFVIEAGKGLQMDPKKIKAIQNWAAPTTVKGVRGFIGFANFHRRFIKTSHASSNR